MKLNLKRGLNILKRIIHALPKQFSMMTLDDIKDLSIIIVGKMVEEGIIKDCTDTDDQTECDAQDVIREILCNKFNIEND